MAVVVGVVVVAVGGSGCSWAMADKTVAEVVVEVEVVVVACGGFWLQLVTMADKTVAEVVVVEPGWWWTVGGSDVAVGPMADKNGGGRWWWRWRWWWWRWGVLHCSLEPWLTRRLSWEVVARWRCLVVPTVGGSGCSWAMS